MYEISTVAGRNKSAGIARDVTQDILCEESLVTVTPQHLFMKYWWEAAVARY